MINNYRIGEHNIFGISFFHIKPINTDVLWITIMFVHFQIRVRNGFVEFATGIGLRDMLFKIKLGFSA